MILRRPLNCTNMAHFLETHFKDTQSHPEGPARSSAEHKACSCHLPHPDRVTFVHTLSLPPLLPQSWLLCPAQKGRGGQAPIFSPPSPLYFPPHIPADTHICEHMYACTDMATNGQRCVHMLAHVYTHAWAHSGACRQPHMTTRYTHMFEHVHTQTL